MQLLWELVSPKSVGQSSKPEIPAKIDVAILSPKARNSGYIFKFNIETESLLLWRPHFSILALNDLN